MQMQGEMSGRTEDRITVIISKTQSSLEYLVQLELEHFLTLHLRSRKFPSTAAYMETVRVLARLADQIRTGSPSPATQQVGINPSIQK